MPGIDLAESSLRVVFSDVDLSGACFRGADVSFCHFDADLSGANFEQAEMVWTNLGRSNFTGANLQGADLRHAEFKSATLNQAVLHRARLEHTSLLDLSVAAFCQASHLVHNGPSYVDHRTILRSIHVPNLKTFLQQIGTPPVFVELMVDCAHELTESAVSKLLRSTFISFGAPDEAFARRLYEALHSNGVRAFFFPEHAVPGRKLHRTMREGVNSFDRVLLVCSRASLSRRGVLNEIEETLQREARDGGASYLIPITLDNYVFDGWSPPDPGTAQAVRDRVVADFTDLDTIPGKFDSALLRLLSALKIERPGHH